MSNQKNIIDKVNQAIIHLGNRNRHHAYGYVSRAFERDNFDLEYNYRTDFAEWYADTKFHDAEVMPKQILNKTAYFEIPETREKSLNFRFRHVSLDTTWGYGKYFDGESIEPTPETEELLQMLTKSFSSYFKTDIIFSTAVDIDYEDDLDVTVSVSLPQIEENKVISKSIKVSISKEERLSNKAKIATEKLNKYNQELIDFNLKVHNKIQGQSSKLKTCTHCESKVNIAHIKTHKCPVCSEPMYSNTDLKRFNNLTARIKNSKEEVKNTNAEISRYLTS